VVKLIESDADNSEENSVRIDCKNPGMQATSFKLFDMKFNLVGDLSYNENYYF